LFKHGEKEIDKYIEKKSYFQRPDDEIIKIH